MNNENWKFQISVKCGPGGEGLFNARANDETELSAVLDYIKSNGADIAVAVASFAPKVPPAPVTPRPSEGHQQPQEAPSKRTDRGGTPFGPVLLQGYETKSGTSASGRAWTRHVGKFPGFNASTFDGLVGEILRNNVGKMVSGSLETTDKGKNLLEVRPV